VYLAAMIQQVDSSLMQEWERMRDPKYQAAAETKELRPPGSEEADQDVTRDTKGFTAMVRTRIFMFLRGLVNGDFEQALGSLTSLANPDGDLWAAEKLRERLDAYYVEHKYFGLDPN